MAENDGLTAAATDGQTILGGSPEPQSATDGGDVQPEGSNGSVTQQAEGNVDTPKWLEQAPRDLRDRLAGLGHREYRAFMEDALGVLENKDSLIQKPAEDASQDVWDRYWQSVGRPDDPNGYELPDAEKFGEFAGAFKEAAHRMGLTTNQAKNLFEWYGKQDQVAAEQRSKKAQEQVQEVQDQLKSEWGDKFESQLKNIDRFKAKYGSEQLSQELQNPVVGNNVELIKALAQAGADLAGDSLIEGDTKSAPSQNPGHFQYPWMRESYPKKDF